jgi:Ca2+-binding EF-hand superfamily protein
MMSKFRHDKKAPTEIDEELREIFKVFDKNLDGFIDNHELKDVLVRLGETISDVSFINVYLNENIRDKNTQNYIS